MKFLKLIWIGSVTLAVTPMLVVDRENAETVEYLHMATPGLSTVKKDKGSKGEWKINCKADELEDTRFCFVRQLLESRKLAPKSSDFVVIVTGKGYSAISLSGGQQFPGMNQIIRVDKNTPRRFKSDDQLSINGEIEQELINGTSLLTRWYKWPSQSPVNQKISLKGFVQALEIARAASAMKTLPLDIETIHATAWK